MVFWTKNILVENRCLAQLLTLSISRTCLGPNVHPSVVRSSAKIVQRRGDEKRFPWLATTMAQCLGYRPRCLCLRVVTEGMRKSFYRQFRVWHYRSTGHFTDGRKHDYLLDVASLDVWTMRTNRGMGKAEAKSGGRRQLRVDVPKQQTQISDFLWVISETNTVVSTLSWIEVFVSLPSLQSDHAPNKWLIFVAYC